VLFLPESRTGQRMFPVQMILRRIDRLFATRQEEANEFYASRIPRISRTTRKLSCARHLAACFGASSFITTMFTPGLRRSCRSSPAAGALERPQQGLDAPVQRRHHFHAGQLGISVVRRLGPGVSLHSAGVVDPDFAKNSLFCCFANGICTEWSIARV